MLVDAEPTPPFSRHLVPAERGDFSAHGRAELLAQGGQRRGRPGARSREQPIDRAREHDPSPVSSSTHRSGGRYDSSCAGSGRGARSRSIRSSKASPTASHRSPGQIAFRTGGEACSDSRQLASMSPVRGRRHRKNSDNVLVELCAWSLIGMPAGFQDPPTPHRFPAHAFEPGGAPSRLLFPADADGVVPTTALSGWRGRKGTGP